MIFKFLEFQINGIIEYVIFHVQLILLSMLFLRIIHADLWISTTSFPLLSSIPLYGYTTAFLSIHLLTDI